MHLMLEMEYQTTKTTSTKLDSFYVTITAAFFTSRFIKFLEAL